MKFKHAISSIVIALLLLIGQGYTAQAAGRAAVAITAGTVTVTGDRIADSDLVATLSGWPSQNVTFKYQWYRNGVKIKGATSATYSLTDSDFFGFNDGNTSRPSANITVTVTASAPGYKAISVSSSAATTSSGKICTQLGSAQSDLFEGTKGIDVLCGFGGNDTFLYSKSKDVIDGGDGSDAIDISMETKDATVDLVLGTATVKGGSVTTLMGIENVQTGSGADRVIGNSQDNFITTFSEDNSNDRGDYVSAGDGNDVIATGPGDDEVVGGAGDDAAVLGFGDDSFQGGTGANYCDLADSFDDELVDCTSTDAKPELVSVQTPVHGTGTYTFTVRDPFRLTSGASLYFLAAVQNGYDDIMQAEETYLDSTNGITTTWKADFSLDYTDGRPADGDWYLDIGVSTFDGRNVNYLGQSDGKYGIHEPNYFSWIGLGEKIGEVESVGPTSVLFNWDTVAPAITSATLSAASVDTSSASRELTAHLVATDAGTNHFFASCELVTFQDNLSVEANGEDVEFDGSGDCTAQVPESLPTGTYGMAVSVSDSEGNTTALIPTEIGKYAKFSGYTVSLDNYGDEGATWDQSYSNDINLEFQQSGTGDNESASFASINWDRSIVSTRTAGAVVTARIVLNGVTDNRTQISCYAKNPSARIQALEGESTSVGSSGNTWDVSFELPKKAPKGKYLIGCSLKDSIGWYSGYVGQADGTFITSGVNAANPVSNPGSPYFRVG